MWRCVSPWGLVQSVTLFVHTKSAYKFSLLVRLKQLERAVTIVFASFLELERGEVCTHLKIDDMFCCGFQNKNVIMQKFILKTNSNDQCWQIRTKTPWVDLWQIEIFIRKRWLRKRQSTRSAKYLGGLFLAQPPFERRPPGSPASLLSNSQFCFTTFPRTA